MMSLRKSEIPEYLKEGELYRTLMENNDDPNEKLNFHSNVMKGNTTVHSVLDSDHLLNSLRFWGVEGFVSIELIEFALSCPEVQRLVEVLQEYESEFKYVHWLRHMLEVCLLDRAKVAFQSGIIELLRPVVDCGDILPSNACNLAAEVGNVDVFMFFMNQGFSWTNRTGQVAARHGNTNILKLLTQRGYKACGDDLLAAIQGGHLECVKSDVFAHPMLEYTTQYDPGVCNEAVRYGNLPMLKYLRAVGYPWSTCTTYTAAYNGNYHCLQYLHEHGCEWNNRDM